MTSKLLSMLRLVGRHLGPSIFAALTALATTVGMCGVVNAMGSQSQLTYQQTDSGQSGQTQQAHVPLPWTTQFSFNGSRVFVISAQSLGSITCTILIDGKVVSEASANGAP